MTPQPSQECGCKILKEFPDMDLVIQHCPLHAKAGEIAKERDAWKEDAERLFIAAKNIDDRFGGAWLQDQDGKRFQVRDYTGIKEALAAHNKMKDGK